MLNFCGLLLAPRLKKKKKKKDTIKPILQLLVTNVPAFINIHKHKVPSKYTRIFHEMHIPKGIEPQYINCK